VEAQKRQRVRFKTSSGGDEEAEGKEAKQGGDPGFCLAGVLPPTTAEIRKGVKELEGTPSDLQYRAPRRGRKVKASGITGGTEGTEESKGSEGSEESKQSKENKERREHKKHNAAVLRIEPPKKPCGKKCQKLKCSELFANWKLFVPAFRSRVVGGTINEVRSVINNYIVIGQEEHKKTKGSKLGCKCAGEGCLGRHNIVRKVMTRHRFSVPVCEPGPTIRGRRERLLDVCTNMFLQVLDGVMGRRALSRLIQCKASGTSIFVQPRGGANHTLDPSVVAKLYDFVNSRPRLVKHYALVWRAKQIGVTLEPEWLPEKLYTEFLEQHDPEYCQHLKRVQAGEPSTSSRKQPLLSLSQCRKMLKQLNYRVGKTTVDKCSTCYEHYLFEEVGQLTAATRKQKVAAKEHTKQREVHLMEAEVARELERRERTVSVDAVQKVGLLDPQHPREFCSVDGIEHMQVDKGSRVPLPVTGTGAAWYLSRSSVIPEIFCSTARGRKSTVFMWENSEAGAGQNEMISCFYCFLMTMRSGFKRLTLWADNCFHEFKHWLLCWFLDWMCARGRRRGVDVKYYEKGHSFMGGFGPDSTHSKIVNRGKKPRHRKQTLNDWLQIAADSHGAATAGIDVIDFRNKNHRDWESFLKQRYTKYRNQNLIKDKDGNLIKFDLRKCKYLNIYEGYDENGVLTKHPGELWARYSLDKFAKIYRIPLLRTRQPAPIDDLTDEKLLDSRYDVDFHALTDTQLDGIAGVWKSLDHDVRPYWKEIFLRQLTEERLERLLNGEKMRKQSNRKKTKKTRRTRRTRRTRKDEEDEEDE